MELPLLDGHIDSDNVLPNNTSSTNLQVPAYSFVNKYASTGKQNECHKVMDAHPTSELPINPSLRPTAVP
jgi:hypothetical protein